MIDSGAISALNTLAQKPKAPDLSQVDPEKAKKAAEIKAKLDQALVTAKNTKNDAIAQRKALAAQTVARIKEALKNLRMYAGADPKVIARMAKQLAKELAAALKDYAAAGATPSEQASAGSAPQSQTDASDKAKDETVDDADASTQQTAVALPSIPVTNEAKPLSKDEKDKLGEAANAYARGQHITEQRSLIKTGSADDDQDRSFAEEARKVLDELRNLVKTQKARLKHDPDKESQDVIHDAEKSLEQATESLRHINFSLILKV